MRFKQFGMVVVILLLTLSIGGFGCSSSSSSSSDNDGAATGGELKALAPADFSATTGQLSINDDGKIKSSGKTYSFILTGDAELPEGAIAADVTYAWTTDTAGIAIANPNQKSTEVRVPSSATGTVEFKLTVTYKEKSSEAVTNVTLTSASSHTLYVAADGTGNGSNWANALPGNGETKNLQTVIDEAGRAVADREFEALEVWVKAGTYLPTWNWNVDDDDARYSSFRLQSGVSVVGGFAGYENSKDDRAKSDVAGRIYANETILSGDLEGDDDPLVMTCGGDGVTSCSDEGAYLTELALGVGDDNSIHVVYNQSSFPKNAILDGVVISGGNATGVSGDDSKKYKSGAGIYNAADASPTIISSIIRGNYAKQDGGGIYNNSAGPAIISSIIQGNSADASGGGIYNSQTKGVFITASIAQFNYADFGGGIFNYESTPTIRASVIKSNYAISSGGGTYDNKSQVIYKGVVIKDNYSAWLGGGMFFGSTSGSTILSSVVQNNTSAGEGGGMYSDGDIVGVINSTIVGNSAGTVSGGGGIYAKKDLSVYNSILSGNTGAGATNQIHSTSVGGRVFYSVIDGVAQGTDTTKENYQDIATNVLFYEMFDGAIWLKPIELSSYIVLIGGEERTYTLPNTISNVKAKLDNFSFRNSGVTVYTEDGRSTYYYQSGDKVYTIENWPIDLDESGIEYKTITGRDLLGAVDEKAPDIGTVRIADDATVPPEPN